MKNGILISAMCLILFVSKTHAGKVHDKTLADTCYTILEGFTLWQDTGYQGYMPEGVKVLQPKKKPRGRELTAEEKRENARISSYRVRVNHAIGSAKRCRIVKDECRLRKNNFVNYILHTCAALHNFRIKHKPFQY
ncbi:MAG: transposase family protein [Mediterranea sp.]|nr:transposase family protein [Mediterranea sp.]